MVREQSKPGVVEKERDDELKAWLCYVDMLCLLFGKSVIFKKDFEKTTIIWLFS